MTTVDELLKQIINAQLAEQFGPHYGKFREYFEGINEKNKANSVEMHSIKTDIKDTKERIKDFDLKFVKILNLETVVKKLNDSQSSFGQNTNNKITVLENKGNDILKNIKNLDEADKVITQNIFSISRDFSQKSIDLENKIAVMEQNYKVLEKINNTNSQRIASLESKNWELSQKISEIETKTLELSQKISENETKNDLSQSTPRPQPGNESYDQTDKIINSFNSWASSPDIVLPRDFSYVTGDFKIRTNQQDFEETREETKWIINRKGAKIYLLPNPNSFDQMTNLDLYEMDLNMLKGKGKNKIRIITPCEISSSGFIEFKGKLQILA